MVLFENDLAHADYFVFMPFTFFFSFVILSVEVNSEKVTKNTDNFIE